MLHLLSPNLRPSEVYSMSFGDALSRVTTGYNKLQDELKKDNISATRRARLTSYRDGDYMPKALILFQLDDMADVIALAQALKEAADTALAVQD